MPDVLVVPSPRAMVRRALPNVLVGKVAPVVLFLAVVELAGTTTGLLAALAWSLGVIGHRVWRGQRVPGLLVVGTVGLVARTIAAILTGSLVVYFVQPTITTALVGAAFAVSVLWGRPLAERLAHDVCPFDPHTAAHPELRRFFTRLSLVWAATSLANAAVTLWLLLTTSTTTFVLVKSFLGPVSTALAVGLGLAWFRWSTRGTGLRLQFGGVHPAALVARATPGAA